jgi:hypothetical protein
MQEMHVASVGAPPTHPRAYGKREKRGVRGQARGKGAGRGVVVEGWWRLKSGWTYGHGQADVVESVGGGGGGWRACVSCV